MSEYTLAEVIENASSHISYGAGHPPYVRGDLDRMTVSIESAFYLIPRTEIPAATVIVRDGVPHIQVEGAEAGTWKASGNHAQARKWGLEYLAAAQAMETWQAKQAVLEQERDKRRDELAHELVGHYTGRWDTLNPAIQRAIDRIIELENRSV